MPWLDKKNLIEIASCGLYQLISKRKKIFLWSGQGSFGFLMHILFSDCSRSKILVKNETLDEQLMNFLVFSYLMSEEK